ncbi:MAG: ABC transporter six-transmembrane domain-containing protein [Bacteroidota bacterium]
MTLKVIFAGYRYRLILTLVLILFEAGMMLLFPLFIGKAIDGALKQQWIGVAYLGALGLLLLVVGMARRMFDSRFYARLYRRSGSQLMERLARHDTSVKTARLGMIRELIEFLENALPELIANLLGLVGVSVILATLHFTIFYASAGLALIILSLYWFSRNKTLRYNRQANNELEQQVTVLSQKNDARTAVHLYRLMKWNIRLSDLEAINFSISWLFALAFLIFSIIVSVGEGPIQYGALMALVMYVFEYIGNVINLPLYYQNWLRLKEIISRLNRAPN